MRALDLFCGAGGVSMGLARAGFAVTGVDIRDQPNYCGTRFIKQDVLLLDYRWMREFDFIWASPPCQHFSPQSRNKAKHPDLIKPVRNLLKLANKHYCIENTAGAPLRTPVFLCGAMFGLGVIRHRYFETAYKMKQPDHPKHKGSLLTGEYVTVAGRSSGIPAWTYKEAKKRGLPPPVSNMEIRSKAMGINWMSSKELSQAIPPAYAEYIGKLVMKELT